MILPNGFSWSHPRKPKSPPLPSASQQEPVQPESANREPIKQDNQSRFALDQLGEQGEEMAEQVNAICTRFDEMLTLRDEFGAFIQTFEELMEAHKRARTRLAEQAALLTQHLNTSTTLRKEVTELETRAAAADAEIVGLRHELPILQQQAQSSVETIKVLKLEAAESASRAALLERQLLFEADRSATLQEANAAKDVELKALDRQCAENQKQITEQKNAITSATAEVTRLQNLLGEMQPELQRGKQRQMELESALQKADLTIRTKDEKIAQEIKEREMIVAKHEREKYELGATISGLNLQLDGLNSRHAITLQHLEQARASHDENFESMKQWERSSKEAKAALSAAERRLQLSEEQLQTLEIHRTDLEKSLSDVTARNEMLTKAIAAKDAQISHLQNKANSYENRFGSLLQSHENEHLQHDAAKRKLLEMLESEKAERVLAQGALTIARASREKMSVQIETLKRGRPSNIFMDVFDDEADSGSNVRMISSSEIPGCVKE